LLDTFSKVDTTLAQAGPEINRRQGPACGTGGCGKRTGAVADQRQLSHHATNQTRLIAKDMTDAHA
jgi:hypothetical protein